MTALFDRSRTGRGQLVEVAMQEAVVPTLASSLGMMFGTSGGRALRTGNRHSGLAIAPYNVYPARDGHVAIIVLSEAHWAALTALMGRSELASDPRFSDNAARCANLDATDALIETWTSARSREDIAALAKAARVPCAPVREIAEVMADRHMHERGMLEWVDHPRLGRTVLPNSPLRFHGSDPVIPRAAPDLGGDNFEVLSDLLGLDPDEVHTLKSQQVI